MYFRFQIKQMIYNNTFSEAEIIGYFKEYYSEGKFIGSLKVNSNDQKGFGYKFRVIEKAVSDIKIGKKTIKKGSEYYTVVMPLCGQLKKNINK